MLTDTTTLSLPAIRYQTTSIEEGAHTSQQRSPPRTETFELENENVASGSFPVPFLKCLGVDELPRVLVSFFLILQVGMSDASLGAQLDYIQAQYDLSYSLVSLIFLFNYAGWFISCPLTPLLLHHIGFKDTLLIAVLCNGVGSLIVSFAPPFFAVVIGLIFLGVGAGINDATTSTYMACYSSEVMLSLLYAFLGVGALIAPLIIATMLNGGISWNAYYYVPLGMSVFAVIPICIVFRRYYLPEDENVSNPEGISKRLKRTVSSPLILGGGILVALALTSGDILSSWIVSFMTSIRRGDGVKMRYVLSGFWAGQTIGRIILAYPTPRIGAKYSLSSYIIICLGLLAVVQFVPSIPGDAVAVALTGVFLGPVTPTIISCISRQVPPSLVSPAVSFMTGIGLVGSAIGPLAIGFVSNAGGLQYLASIIMGLLGILLVLWQIESWYRPKKD